jgi:hypothetical protein
MIPAADPLSASQFMVLCSAGIGAGVDATRAEVVHVTQQKDFAERILLMKYRRM